MAIIFVNEEKSIFYNTEDDIRRLIRYMMNPDKTMFDEKRPGHMIGDFAGCSVMWGTREMELNSEHVANRMIANNRAHGKTEGNLIKHRVISFYGLDYIMPDEANELAAYLAKAYGESYITAYAVHVDTCNIHIHLAVNTIGWLDGKRFSISYESRWLHSIVNNWMASRDINLSNDYKKMNKIEEYYGI
uniref:relaxase/mobilization nuclease domain-containing protein n=1 Tax=Enterocloster hominis (ex Hitch et al. 2024) TaxID=1917870 RepID=UPI0010307E6D|nr:relaxase/mobilization nuclease domain-containing protein [Lachnoclostridium pacaense]